MPHNLRFKFTFLQILPLLLTSPLPSSSFATPNPTRRAPTTQANANETCQQLQSTLGTSIVQTPNDPRYNAGATASWNLFNTEFSPACIVFPTNASHVQGAMKAIFDGELDYAVQAGGHSAMKGWNNVDNGILISFSEMKEVTYNAESDTITLQPGIHWEDAVAGLEEHGVSAVGARYSDVGAGFLLGGGISFLSGSQGYGADSYVELDVVLVNGTLVTARKDNEYADLFKALKGGANRFGIVTRFEVEAVHTGREEDKSWYGGSITYPISSANALLQAVANFAANSNDTNAELLTTFDYVGYYYGISYLFYNSSDTTLFNKTFSEFLSIPSNTTSLGALSYIDISHVLDSSTDSSGHGQLFAASALSGESPIGDYIESLRLWTNYSTTFSDELYFSVITFSPVTQGQIDIGREKGGNVIDSDSDAESKGGYNNVMFQVALPEGVESISEEMQDGRMFYLNNVPTRSDLPYNINECDASQNVFATYGGYEFLKSTYAKYDPTGFNLAHTQGPVGL